MFIGRSLPDQGGRATIIQNRVQIDYGRNLMYFVHMEVFMRHFNFNVGTALFINILKFL
uniref:Uncharacterized protein n=1 Tax=uncultured Aminicenantes bacterium TaxID=174294 RepID=Q2YZZ1_9BACT|nr:hypothetical protein [uncultured Aminicenantes bacterium]